MQVQSLEAAGLSQALKQGIAAIPDGVLLVDVNGMILYLNEATSVLTGWTEKEALGRPAREVFRVINALTGEVSWDPLASVLQDHQSYSLLPNSVLVRRDGSEVPIEDTISPIQDEAGEAVGAIILFRDVSLTRWQVVKALHRAQHDPLTCLPNRDTLHKRVLSALAGLGRGSVVLCLLFIDLDHFKEVNDRFGHATGDLVLQVLAGRLASCLRGSDLVCRVGGDEFVIVLGLNQGLQDLEPVVQKLLETGRSPIEVLGSSIALSLSIGIATRRKPSRDVDGLIADADLAAYRAKAAGGDRVQLFESHFRQIVTPGCAGSEDEMKEALRAGRFFLDYQPMIDCRTGRIASLEALVRWRQQDGRILHPANFIAGAERSGFIVPLGMEVLRQALAQRNLWAQQGVAAFHLSVNVSAVEIMSERYLVDLQELLGSYNYEPNTLTLELTESSLIGLEEQQSALPAIRKLGVELAIDDFGVGYSNVGYLRNCTVDAIKIDRLFVAGVPHQSQDSTLVKAIIAMSRSIRTISTAEGVETLEQAHFLRAAGCTQVQGQYFSPPVSPETIATLSGYDWKEAMPPLTDVGLRKLRPVLSGT